MRVNHILMLWSLLFTLKGLRFIGILIKEKIMAKIPIFVVRNDEYCDESCPFLDRNVWETYSTCKLFDESLANIFDDINRMDMLTIACSACDILTDPQNTKES